MFSYANCTTPLEFQSALCGQIELWKADHKPLAECHKLLFDYIRAVNSRLYEQGQTAVGIHGVMERLHVLLETRADYNRAQMYQAVHDVLFPVSRDFTPGQLQEVVPLVYTVLELLTDARVVQIPVDRQIAALIDNILGDGVLNGQLEAMHPLTAYTNDTGVFSTGLDMDARKKDKDALRRAIHESSLDTYENEQMMWAMQDAVTDNEEADIEEAIRRSMMLDD